ncbi:MAG: hypothetical protein CMN73_00495 [Sphingomonas sp.]|nr:hypothetical protein [Sphingomonas sp.]|tara:strand:- start:1943 stop:2461 length:519 start_codon:yes stop_codon:yes gene_type:complete
MFAVIAVLLLSPAPQDAGQDCPIERAQYVLRAMPTITAQFHAVPRTDQWRSGYAMEMRFEETGRRYWWLPDPGGSADNPGFYFTRGPGSAVTDNLGRLDFFGFDSDYTMLASIPVAGEPAPAHFLLYNMRAAYWYGTPGDRREDAGPRSLFDFAACAAPDKSPPAVEMPEMP